MHGESVVDRPPTVDLHRIGGTDGQRGEWCGTKHVAHTRRRGVNARDQPVATQRVRDIWRVRHFSEVGVWSNFLEVPRGVIRRLMNLESSRRDSVGGQTFKFGCRALRCGRGTHRRCEAQHLPERKRVSGGASGRRGGRGIWKTNDAQHQQRCHGPTSETSPHAKKLTPPDSSLAGRSHDHVAASKAQGSLSNWANVA